MNVYGESPDKSDYKLCTQKIVLYILCGLLILSSTVVLITFIVIYVPKLYTANYAVVIDAGSTGSRAYLYKWNSSAGVKNDLVTELSNCKADKLQNLDWTNPNNLLIQCISNVVSDIPSSFMNRPYIYLASTAGMRLYELQKPKETEVLLQNINAIFLKKNWRTEYVGIISGEEEGISAWITANVLKNKIGKDLSKQDTVGALDLGGSSTQIAYETSTSRQVLPLFSYSYPIYSKSYLCYGAEMFNLKYVSYVAITSNETAYSCILKNSVFSIPDDVKVCRYTGSQDINLNNWTKPILPNFDNCKKQVHSIVSSDMKFKKAPSDAKFVAMSTYNYVYSFLRKYYNINQTIPGFQAAVEQFCKEDYNAIPNKFTFEKKYAPVYCTIGTYILELFQGFGITDLRNLEFTDKIDGQNVGWNLGYMIEKTRSIPENYLRKMDTSLFIAVIVMCSVILMASLLAMFYLVWERHQKVKNMDP